MLLDIRHLQQVSAISRLRSLGRAAAALGVSQPALSKSIRVLEKSLGVPLFERSHRGVTPTTYGEVLLSVAGPMLRSADEALAEIHRLQGLEIGSLRIGAGPFALELSVAGAAFRVARRAPGLHLRVAHGGWESLTRDVASGALDVAVADVAAAEQTKDMVVERLGTHRGSFYCRTGHPLTARSRIAFEDLTSFPFAMTSMPPRLAPFLDRQGPAGRVDPATGLFLPALTLDQVSLMKRAVLETDAVSWAPDALLVEEVKRGELTSLPLRADWAHLDYGIIRRADRPVTPALEAFLTELRGIEKSLAGSARPRRRPVKSRRR
jgi:DNA-binding transcriptional LysR family regulator